MSVIIRLEQALRPPLRPLTSTFSPPQAVTCSTLAKSECLIIIFSGAARQFALPLTLLDRFFAGYGMRVMSLVDKNRAYYINGISELGDSFDASIEKFKALAKDYGAKRIITAGHSAGGTAALDYGVALDACHILAYTPVGNLSLDFFDYYADYRNRPKIRRVNQLVSVDRLDVKAVLDKGDFRGQFGHYAGEYCVKDLVHVDYLSDLHRSDVMSLRMLLCLWLLSLCY